MLIPSCFYGTLKDIKREMKKTAKKLLAGKSVEESFSAYPMHDSDDYPESTFFISLTIQNLCTANDFHFPWLIESISSIVYEKQDTDKDKKIQKCFLELLEKDWSALCLCEAQNSLFWNPIVHDENTFNRQTRWLTFVSAMLNHWDSYVKMGNVFDNDEYEINTIWERNTALRYVLANLGVPHEVLSSPLPDMNLQMIIDKYDILNFDINSLPWR